MLLPALGTIDYEFDTETFNAAGEVFIQRLGLYSGAIVLGIIIIALMAKYFMPTFSKFSTLVLAGHEEEGYVASGDVLMPKPGDEASVYMTLRPAGKIQIGDEIFDAQSRGGFIEKAEVSSTPR